MGFIVLPQALTRVIPGIVNNFIGLFKDTTLVLIVAIFDLLGQLRAAFSDPELGDADHALYRLRLRRHDLFRVLLCHVALFVVRRAPAWRQRGAGTDECVARSNEPAAVEMVRVHKWYGDVPRVARHRSRRRARRAHRDLRAVGLRQIDADPLHQRARARIRRAGSSSTASSSPTISAASTLVRREVGMVFQQFNLFPHLTVLENCTLALIWVRRMPRRGGGRDRHALSEARAHSGAGAQVSRASFPAVSSSASRSRVRYA